MKKILVVAALMLSSVSTFAQHAVGSFNLQPKVVLVLLISQRLRAQTLV